MMAQKSIEHFGEVVIIVPSKSEPGKNHPVIIKDGIPWCDCKGFKYNRCPHIPKEIDPNGIYSTVPAKAIQETPDDDRYKILGHLQDNPGEWITSVEIAKATGYKVGNSQPEVRKAITLLLELDNEPIISGHAGYKLAQSEEEIQTYINELVQRQFGLTRRIEALRNIIQGVRK